MKTFVISQDDWMDLERSCNASRARGRRGSGGHFGVQGMGYMAQICFLHISGCRSRAKEQL